MKRSGVWSVTTCAPIGIVTGVFGWMDDSAHIVQYRSGIYVVNAFEIYYVYLFAILATQY